MPYPIVIAGRSHVGRVRRRNEDSFAILPELGVAVVADGMGGHPGGDVASRIAADTCGRVLGDAVEAEEAGGTAGDFVERFRDIMNLAILKSHGEIRQQSSVEPELDGMGTTLTAIVVDRDSGVWVIGHVGDSRAYRFRDGSLVQLTKDDTWVQEQVDRGEIQPESAKLSPYAHLLTQCVGLDEPPNPHLLDGSGRSEDLYLLCTDGLVGMLADDRVAEILADGAGSGSTDEKGRLAALLEAANEAGGQDNITAALVRFE